MQEFQERVINEKRELDEKINNLANFIDFNKVFKTLPKEERSRLRKQCNLMIKYSNILQERIDNFN